jgi:hypothetical protein
MSLQLDQNGLRAVQLGISASISQNSGLEILCADLSLATDVALAFAEMKPTGPRSIAASVGTVASALSFGAYVVFARDFQANQPKIFCHGRNKGNAQPLAFVPPDQRGRFEHIIFENSEGLVLNANAKPLGIGINSAPLIIRDNESSIAIAGNLREAVPAPRREAMRA